jgi:hypothetical protein
VRCGCDSFSVRGAGKSYFGSIDLSDVWHVMDLAGTRGIGESALDRLGLDWYLLGLNEVESNCTAPHCFQRTDLINC